RRRRPRRHRPPPQACSRQPQALARGFTGRGAPAHAPAQAQARDRRSTRPRLKEPHMPEAVIVETARTPIGRALKGSLKDVRPDDMGGFIIKTLMEKVPAVEPASVDDVIMGSANHSGEQGMNYARNVAALAGLPDTVPGTSVNRFCASSLQTIRMGFHAIKAGEGDTFVAGGLESVSRTGGKGFSREDMHPRFTDESRPDFVNHMYIPMGLTAENVAEKYDVSRERMDEFAALSQNRAVEAQKNGFFDRELTPYPLED